MKKITPLLLCFFLISCSESPSDLSSDPNEYDFNGTWIRPQDHTSPRDRALEEARYKAWEECVNDIHFGKSTKSPDDCDARKLNIN